MASPRLIGLSGVEHRRAGTLLINYVPVVILACSQEDDEVMKCYSLGANAYTYEPIDSVRFQHELVEVAEFWLRASTSSGEHHNA